MEIQSNDMACDTPFNVMDANKRIVPVPCGKCGQCVKRRVSGWSFRLMQEDRISSSAHFITLTYDRSHCPISKNGFMDLNPEHLRNFFKRLRINTDRTPTYITVSGTRVHYIIKQPIKYYAVGEYGEKSGRPHYHAIIFNAELNQFANAWKDKDGKMIGDLHYGTVSGASVGYTMKYMSKLWHPKQKNDDRTPVFARMSKKLGASYLTDAVKAWHHDDLENNMHLTLKDGRKIAMPRYYKERIYTAEQKGYLKGYFEATALDKDYQDFLKSEGIHEKNHHKSVNASFKRMYYSSTLTESL